MTTIHKVPQFAKYTKDLGSADPSSDISYLIALKLRNTNWIDQQLKEVSDPTSKNYGKVLSKEEIEEMTRPSQEHFDRVTNYLKSHGIDCVQREGDNLRIKTSIEKTEKLFHTHIHKFAQPEGGKPDDFIFRREGNFQVPPEICDYVDLVVGF
eukprot:gene10073-12348_t